MSLPTETTVAKALTFLGETDVECAQCKSRMTRAKENLKVVKAVAMLESGEKSTSAQETHAYVSESYQAAVDEYADAVLEYETILARRHRAELSIEVWRSTNANRRQGNVT